MKVLQRISLVILLLTVLGFMLWRFIFPLPDWSVRVIGIAMLVAIFAGVFSTVRTAAGRK